MEVSHERSACIYIYICIIYIYIYLCIAQLFTPDTWNVVAHRFVVAKTEKQASS